MSQRWVLDEIVDAFGATVLVERDADGRPAAARFDLTGLPRVDSMLAGQPVATVPALVERLCGICPVAHHLAGVRALDALAGAHPTPTGVAVRSLLHHGASIQTHAARLATVNPQAAATLRTFGRAVCGAAGSPGHFPATAVVGGVVAVVAASARDALATQAAVALDAAVTLARHALARSTAGSGGPQFAGADVALAGDGGRPDLLGQRLRVVAADGSVLEPGALPGAWDDLVAESVPGAPAPRPYLVALGPQAGRYRVGPVSQLRTGELTTPVAAAMQAQWAAGGGAAAARAVLTVHCVEVVARLLDDEALTSGTPCETQARFDRPGVGVGWADGPRGLLVHRYLTDGQGMLTAAVILTPTAQNEQWLAELLLDAAAGANTGVPDGVVAGQAGLEDAVREADPCLPVASAPPGAMGLRVQTVGGSADPQPLSSEPGSH
ncbi:MAG: nickel-dependent hydrogenase large subunit [Micrococcales bacterium]|nr:nickel-dependent hydrogenase large subunit [Micrococcales bacterium]